MSPKSSENLNLSNSNENEKKSFKTRDKFIGAGAAAALALGLAACGPGEDEPNAGPNTDGSTIENPMQDPVETTEPEYTVDPTEEGPESPETSGSKEWGKFELPTPEREVLYDFGSKEEFLDWFVIDADTYTTPEDIAKKHVMNLEGLINAGFSYQLDRDIGVPPGPGENLSHGHVAAVHEAYDIPIMQRIATPEVDVNELIDYDYKLTRSSLFLTSYYDRRDDIPYVTSGEYHDSTVIEMNGDSFADATELTVEIHRSDSDNGLRNLANWFRQAGEPAQYSSDYVDRVTFTLSGDAWLVSSRDNISVEGHETP